MKSLIITMQQINYQKIAQKIKAIGIKLGFAQIGITDCDLTPYSDYFRQWIKQDYHGEMGYMTKHGAKRLKPDALIPGTSRIIMTRMNYHPPATKYIQVLQNKNMAAISRYALGKDYHKLMRKRLNLLAKEITKLIGDFNYRAFADSGPVLEKALAAKAGLGWYGKNSLILNAKDGSYFFLGTIYTDLPLPIDKPTSKHCGSCTACIDICPTKAIVAPKVLDARRCISYLTIEYKGSIPLEFRTKIGNRIFGCDDCQLICPWNKFSKITLEPSFFPRLGLDNPTLASLFLWTEQQFYKYTEGSAIRRTGYTCWLRNIAIAIGNTPASGKNIKLLQHHVNNTSEIVREHVQWAMTMQNKKIPITV